MDFDLEFLHQIRAHELAVARRLLPPPPARLLEIGPGSGHLARRLTAEGYAVTAVDIEGSIYAPHAEFPIQLYDGVHLPFPDASFDVVFSSSVLTEIPDRVRFLRETRRVVRPGGTAVHSVSSSSWRLWTNLTHYPYVIRSILRRAADGPREPDTQRPPPAARAARLLVPDPLAEGGSALEELWTLSASAFSKDFEAAGWHVLTTQPSGIVYAGHMLLGPRLSLESRRRLARLLGSSSLIFSLR